MIGKGAIGCVYKSLDIESGEIVAIKQVGIKHLKKGRLEML
jgi:serine/threonine protein kinase